MGKSNSILMSKYNNLIPRIQPTALLGFRENVFGLEDADTYDTALGNWDINSDWSLCRKYNSIISTRCPYFAKDPHLFIKKCHHHLNPGGHIFLDWGFGDHWRFKDYKIGWLKNGEQEFCYGKSNYLWSGIWDDSFKAHPQFKLFSKRVEKYGYNNVEKAIKDETPSLIGIQYISKFFDIKVDLLALWEDSPQLYIFVKGTKK